MGSEKIRPNLTDLMKENENNKRENEAKTREIIRLNEKINTLNSRLNRINLKLENLKHEKNNNHSDLGISNLKKHNDELKEQTIMDSISNIPTNLDFRLNSLKIEYSSK